MNAQQLLSFIIDYKVSIVAPRNVKDYWTLGVGSPTTRGQSVVLDGDSTPDEVRQGLHDLWRKAVEVGIVTIPVLNRPPHEKQQK